MEYGEVLRLVDKVWDSFYDNLYAKGLTEDQVLEISRGINRADIEYSLQDVFVGVLCRG